MLCLLHSRCAALLCCTCEGDSAVRRRSNSRLSSCAALLACCLACLLADPSGPHTFALQCRSRRQTGEGLTDASPPAPPAQQTAPWCWARCRTAMVRLPAGLCQPASSCPPPRLPACRRLCPHCRQTSCCSPHAVCFPNAPAALCCRRLLLPPVCPAWRHGQRSHLGPSALQVRGLGLACTALSCPAKLFLLVLSHC